MYRKIDKEATNMIVCGGPKSILISTDMKKHTAAWYEESIAAQAGEGKNCQSRFGYAGWR